jgi:hypothetical protein
MPKIHEGIHWTGSMAARKGDLVDQSGIGSPISQRQRGIDGIDDSPNAGDPVVYYRHTVKNRLPLFDTFVESSPGFGIVFLP